MKKSFFQQLSVRLFFAFLGVILVGSFVLVSVSGLTLRNAFNRHLGPMMMESINQPGPGMPPGQIKAEIAQDERLFRNFREGFFEALWIGGLVAGLMALIASMILSRRILGPIHNLSQASQRIAQGKYDERVKVDGDVELAELGSNFNRMAEQLEQVENMRRQLIGDVSHELRTPLTSIKGYMEALMDGVIPATDEVYSQVHEEAERLSRLVDDLQELSRVQAGVVHLEKEALYLDDIFMRVSKRLLPQYEAKGVQLDIKSTNELPSVLADSDRLIQILSNLMGNALQYTAEGGQVVVSAEVQEKAMFIKVEDNGAGIDAKDLPHVFDRFYRVDKSRSRQKGGGSGIGLTIAYYLVEAHGGRLWAESGGLGKGSCFTFTLPL